MYLISLVLILTTLVNQSLSQHVNTMLPVNPYSKEATELVQKALACFTVTTAKKIMKTKDHEEDKNILFSPLDLYFATALAFLGAEGESRKKLGNILGIKEPSANVHARRRRQQPTSLANIHQTIGALVNETMNIVPAVILNSNAIFVYNDFAIKSTYIEDARNYYGVVVKCTDFKNQSELSTKIINNYIAQRTYQRIPKFFPKPVSTNTTLIIPSSFTVISKWNATFNPNDTYQTAFHTRDDGCEDTNICLMIGLQTIFYFHDTESHLKAIAIPFQDFDLKIYFVVPNKVSEIQQFVLNPNKNILLNIINSMQSTKVKYHIPKMLLTAHINEMSLFKETAIKNLTENEIADFLPLSNLEQITEIELNEEGIGGCELNLANDSPAIENVVDPDAVEFIVDKPYIFFVYRASTKTFLYYGAIFKPRGYDK